MPHTHSHHFFLFPILCVNVFFFRPLKTMTQPLFFTECSLPNFHIIYNLLFECNFITETYHMKWIFVMCYRQTVKIFRSVLGFCLSVTRFSICVCVCAFIFCLYIKIPSKDCVDFWSHVVCVFTDAC